MAEKGDKAISAPGAVPFERYALRSVEMTRSTRIPLPVGTPWTNPPDTAQVTDRGVSVSTGGP